MKQYSLTSHLPTRRASWLLVIGLLLLLCNVGAAQPSGTVFASRKIITKGGTYSGNWESQKTDSAAVYIKTSEPVIIENSIIRSAGHLIEIRGNGTNQANNVIIRNNQGYVLPLTVTAELRRGRRRFVDADYFKNIVIENNYLEGTSGIYLANYDGNRSSNETIKVRYNKAKNIDGRYRPGTPPNAQGKSWEYVQFLQLNGIRDLPYVEIAWNEVINLPGQGVVEDNINLFRSTGTAASPIQVHNNYIQGAYNINYTTDGNHSGGGILMGEGNGVTTLAQASGFARCYNNQVVSTTHYGIAMAGGHDIQIDHNRVISSSVLDNGDYLQAANVGIYVEDQSFTGVYTDRGIETPLFYNNTIHDNFSGYVNRRPDYGYDKFTNPYSIPDKIKDGLAGSNREFNNARVPNTTLITRDMERAEHTDWLSKLSSNGITIGVTTPPTTPVIPNGTYRLVSRNTGQRLGISSTVEGEQVLQQTPSSSSNQHWVITTTNGYAEVRNQTSGKALAVRGTCTANGAVMEQRTPDNASSPQRWRIQAVTSSYYSLSAECSENRFLEVQGIAGSNVVQQWGTTVAGEGQQWALEPINSPPSVLNLAFNPSFELLDNGDTQTPTQWRSFAIGEGDNSSADYVEAVGGPRTGIYHGTHARATPFEVYTYQEVLNLPSGSYTLRGWIKSSGGQAFTMMFARNFGANQRSLPLPVTKLSESDRGPWTLVEIKDINVTNGRCEIGFYSGTTQNQVPWSQWIYFDDVEFFKQPTTSATTSTATLAKTGPSSLSSASLELYPNPAQDQVTVSSSFAQAQEVEVSILTVEGKQAAQYRRQVPAGAGQFNVPTHALPAGMYLLQIQDGKKRHTQRLVVTH